jgi:hypothetical protein
MNDKKQALLGVLLMVVLIVLMLLVCWLDNEGEIIRGTPTTVRSTAALPPTPTSTPTLTPYTQGQAEYDAVRAFNYRGTYFAANPKLRTNAPQIVVHHAVPIEVILRRPCLFIEAELNAAANLRGIPNRLDDTLHNSTIKKAWNEFWRTKPNVTREEVIAEKDRLDKLYDLHDLAYKEFNLTR